MSLFRFRPAILLVALPMLLLSACSQVDLIHQKPVSELNIKAQNLLQQGNVDGALSRLEAAHDLAPNEPTTLFNLAVVNQMKGNDDEAIRLFEQLLAMPGQDAGKIEYNLGIAYESQGDHLLAQKKPDEALLAYKHALDAYQVVAGRPNPPAKLKDSIDFLQDKIAHPEKLNELTGLDDNAASTSQVDPQ